MTTVAHSAPGKLMLFGEFAVLSGYPAIALTFDRRIRCAASSGGGRVRFDAPELLPEPIDLPLGSLGAPPAPSSRCCGR